MKLATPGRAHKAVPIRSSADATDVPAWTTILHAAPAAGRVLWSCLNAVKSDYTWRYRGLFIPSLRRFTFSLPNGVSTGCDGQLGDPELYVGSYRARLPAH